MERITIRAPKEQVEEVDHLVDAGIYQNRSEFMREAMRELLYECPVASDNVASIEPSGAQHGTRLPGGDD
jgi:antitoxin ParD1/3/4